MASLQKKHAWWTLVFTDEHRTPQRKRVALKTRTKETAEKLRRQLEDDYVRGRFDPWTDDPHAYSQPEAKPLDPRPARPVRLQEALDAFLLSRSACREATIRHYRESLAPLVAYIGAGEPATKLTQEALLRWLRSLSCGAQSKATYVSRVGIFARFLVETGALASDPTKRLPMGHVPCKLASKMMSEAHLARFVEAAQQSTAPYMADLVTVAFDLALRRKEVAALRVDWIDFERGRLVLRNEGDFESKSGRETVKPITGRARAILLRYAKGKRPDAPIFTNRRGHPLHDLKRLSRTFRTIADQAGLPRTLTLHSARHGGLSRVLAGGASVEAGRRFAGHSTTAMLMRYVHLLDDQYDAQVLQALEGPS